MSDSDLEQYRRIILEHVHNFAMQKLETSKFIPGKTNIPVSGKVLFPEDITNVVDSVLDMWFTNGRFTENFEKALANFFGIRKSLFVNSGSSANLVAFSTLTSKKLGKRSIGPGDEVITAALGFPTTINPIIQNKATPVFIDIESGTYNIDVEDIKSAISHRTKAIMVAHTLGNPFNVNSIAQICKENNLWLIEDCCDAFGATYDGKLVGTFGDLATLSFYPAHHITSGEGGAVLINSPALAKIAESFRDWGRDCYCAPGENNTCHKRFKWKLGDLPQGYDHKYIYSEIGFNLKATDLQAALGLSQLKHLEFFITARRKNFDYLYKNLKKFEAYLQLPHWDSKSNPSWFGFPITLTGRLLNKRNEFIEYLNAKNIDTRLLFAGNILKQPGYLGISHRKIGNLDTTNNVMVNSFWIGNYPGLSTEHLDYVVSSISEFIDGVKK